MVPYYYGFVFKTKMHAPFMLFEKLRFVSYSCSKILKLTKITQKKKKKKKKLK